jgi:hypothetical protein
MQTILDQSVRYLYYTGWFTIGRHGIECLFRAASPVFKVQDLMNNLRWMGGGLLAVMLAA